MDQTRGTSKPTPTPQTCKAVADYTWTHGHCESDNKSENTDARKQANQAITIRTLKRRTKLEEEAWLAQAGATYAKASRSMYPSKVH